MAVGGAVRTATIYVQVQVNGQPQLKAVQVNLQQLGSALGSINSPLAAMNKGFIKTAGLGTELSKSLSNIRGTIVGLGTAMLTIGSVQIFTKAIQNTLQFQKEMANVSTILDETTQTLPRLTTQINQLDGSLGSSVEQAKALYQALSAGIPAAESVNFVATTAKFAKANLADLDESVKLIASTLNAYGLQVKDAAHVTDIFSNTIKVGIVTGEELTAHLGQVINTAAAAKVPLEEVGAAISILTAKGMPAANAITALNATINTFLKPAPKAAKAAHDMGFELNAATLASDGLLVAMQKLAKITEGNADEVAALFGNYRALRGVLGLTTGDMSKFGLEVEKNKHGIDGLTNSMFELQRQNAIAQFTAAINNLQKALDRLWTQTIVKVTPAIVKFIGDITRLVDAMTSEGFDEKLNNIKNALIGIAAALLLIKLNTLTDGFTNFNLLLLPLNKSLLPTAISLIAGLGKAIYIFGANLFGATAATTTFSGAIAILKMNLAQLMPLWAALAPVAFIATMAALTYELLKLKDAIIGLIDEKNALIDAQANLADTNFKFAKQLHDLGFQVDWARLNDEKYVESLHKMAQEWRKNGGAITVYGEDIKKAGKNTKDLGDNTEKAAEQLAKLDRRFLDIKESLDFKTSKIGSDIFADYLTAVDQFDEKTKAAYDAQRLAHQQNNDLNRQLFSEALQDYEQFGNAWISIASQIQKSFDSTFNPLGHLEQEMENFGKVLMHLNPNVDVFSATIKYYRDTLIETTETAMAQKEPISDLTMAYYEEAVAIKHAEDEERKYIEFRKTQWTPEMQNAIAYWIAYEDRQRKATEATQAFIDSQLRAADAIKMLSTALGYLGDLFGGTFGKGIQVVTAGLDALSETFKSSTSNTEKFTTTLNAMGQALAQMGGKAAAFGNIMMGVSNIIQGIVSENPAAVIAGIAQALGGLFALFKKDWAKEVQKVGEALGLLIPKDLAKEIGELAKAIGSAENAVLLSLDKIAESMGYTSETVGKFIVLFYKAFNTFEVGSENFIKVVEELDNMLPQMLEAATNEFGELNKKMLDFIAYLKQAGIEVAALTEFLNAQSEKAANALNSLIEGFGARVETFAKNTQENIRKILESSLEGKAEEDALAYFDKLVEKGKSIVKIFELIKQKFPDINFTILFTKFNSELITTKAEWQDFFGLLMADINEMIARGVPLVDIFNQVGGSIQTLRDAAIELGLQGDPAFKSLMAFFRVMKTDAAKDLSNLNTLMTTFNNLGIMTKANFQSMQNIFSRVFKEFNKDGKISRAEMTAMLPTLAQMRENAAKYGFELDKDVQAMIDLAIKRHMLPEDMPIDPMTQFANVVNDKLIPVLDKMNGILEKIVGYDGTTIDINANVTTTGDGSIVDDQGNLNNQYDDSAGGGRPRNPTYAGITEPVLITQDEQTVTVHRGESIMPSVENANRSSSGYMPDEVPVYVTVYNDTYIGEEKIDSRITTRMEKGFISPKQARQRLQRER